MDLERMDREVAALSAALRRDPSAVDWEDHRHIAGQRALEALAAESPSPLRDALATSVTWLTVERISQPFVRRATAAREKARVIVHAESDIELDWHSLVHGMLAARSAEEATAYFDAWPRLAEGLGGGWLALHQARQEALHRLGIDDVAAHFLHVPQADLTASAEALITSTTDLAREAARRPSSQTRWPLDLDVRLAREAKSGAWPSRLTWRSAAALLPGLVARGQAPRENADPDACPRAYGAASFARALASIGESFRRVASPASVAFVTREPPLFADVHRTGYLFACVLGEPAFHTRVLELEAGRARDQARLLRTALLLEARTIALRVATRDPRADFEALTAQTFGAPLPPAFRGVWPARSDEDLARFVALVTVTERIDAVRDREGDDWFRNPRAFASLRDLVQTPIQTKVKGGGARLAARFEELLG